MAPNSLNRRQLLSAGLGIAAGGLVSGCTVPGSTNVNRAPVIPAASPGDSVTLTYWSWLKDLQKVCDIWNAENPRIQVKAEWIPSTDNGGYQKMHSALAAEGGPDIGMLAYDIVPEFLLANGLVDLARYGAQEYASRYDEAAWSLVNIGGGIYGVPQDTGPVGFYYQSAILERAGGGPPSTWDEWRELAAKVRSTGSQNYLESFSVMDVKYFISFVRQAGAQWFTTDGDEWVVNMVDEATMRAARFFDGCIDDDLVDTSVSSFSPGWYAAAGAGRIAAVTSASWADALIKSIQDGDGNWRVAPMQRWGSGYGSTFLGGSAASVLANSEHPAEALEFITWMTTTKAGVDAMIEYCGIGWSPARNYIGEQRNRPSAWFGGQNYNQEVFAPASKQQNLDWMWSPLTQSCLDLMRSHFRRKITEGLPLEDAVELTQRDLLQAVRDKGLKARAA